MTRGGMSTSRMQMAAVAMAAVAMSAATVMAATTTFEGVVDSTSGHDDTVWAVTLKNGNVVVLPEAPVSDYDGQEVPLLSTIRVTCTLGNERADGLVADCMDLKPVTVLSTQSLADSDYKVSALTREKTAGVTYGFTMAIIDMPECGFTQPLSVSQVTQRLVQTADMINACSYGQMKIDTARINVTRLRLPLSCRSLSLAVDSCDSTTFREVTQRALGTPGRVGSLHTGVVLPAEAKCKFAALAQVGAPFTWYMPTDYGTRVGTIIQELLHNFGLHHSSLDQGVCGCEGQDNCRCHSEYGDYSTPMGRGDACLTAPEMYRLNWATAIASLDSLSLQPGQPVTYQLPATYSTSTNMIIAKPNWMVPYLDNVYFSLRVKRGYDALLNNTFNGVVSVHKVNQAIDAVSSNDQTGEHLLTTIRPNTNQFQLAQYKLVVSTGALQTGDVMPITLCRYDFDRRECDVASNPGPRDAPPPPSPPVATRQCADVYADCPYWSNQLGYCAESSYYASYMYENCRASCGLCSTSASSCVDREQCAEFVSQYGCEGSLPINNLIRVNCQKSCNTCASSTTALTAASTGQQCVDLAGSCDIFKEVTGCNPTTDNAKLWMRLNCQKTCELCPFSRSGASISDQPPLGCSRGADVKGAKALNTTRGLNLTACWQLCYDTEGCYLFSHYANNDTCVLHTTLEDASKNADYLVKGSDTTTLCVVGTDQTDLKAVPEVQTWFYCVDGLDVPGNLVSILQVKSELDCAKACNETAACRLYTLLRDNSTCVLKSDAFTGDMGNTGDGVTKSCVQTFYTSPADSASSRRRRALIDTSASSVAAGSVVAGGLDGSRGGVIMRRTQALARKALASV